MSRRRPREPRAWPNTKRKAEILRYLERSVWPFVRKRVLGRRMTRTEKDRVLGYGPAGV